MYKNRSICITFILMLYKFGAVLWRKAKSDLIARVLPIVVQ